MKKFKIQEQQIAEQELRHKQTLYEVERKFITGKDKYVQELQKELVFSLVSLICFVYCVLLSIIHNNLIL